MCVHRSIESGLIIMFDEERKLLFFVGGLWLNEILNQFMDPRLRGDDKIWK
ncbi:MAG: hypothetical protein UV68_C0065G0002 [Candidatus Collierbacteria bacterium GW2011_GWC2_43_12]|uniref:Uncharacterized protein n=1 Tax=Candidatus Collierbacteria bacterium GW2011_GWC2_43_12 TaxID=1618390 RepID=A0A0G1FY01_9BACT|nr:MAG: hypothetical protein UV68_C0065G0002 [Candidatus Collierbacteria bacterium GW2011_GWC2_43_12]